MGKLNNGKPNKNYTPEDIEKFMLLVEPYDFCERFFVPRVLEVVDRNFGYLPIIRKSSNKEEAKARAGFDLIWHGYEKTKSEYEYSRFYFFAKEELLRSVKKFVYGLGKEAMEDAISEKLTKVLDMSSEKISSIEEPKLYFYRAVRNTAISQLTRLKKWDNIVVDVLNFDVNPINIDAYYHINFDVHPTITINMSNTNWRDMYDDVLCVYRGQKVTRQDCEVIARRVFREDQIERNLKIWNYYIERWKQKEIAELMGMEVTAVQSVIQKLKEKIRDRYQNQEDKPSSKKPPGKEPPNNQAPGKDPPLKIITNGKFWLREAENAEVHIIDLYRFNEASELFNEPYTHLVAVLMNN